VEREQSSAHGSHARPSILLMVPESKTEELGDIKSADSDFERRLNLMVESNSRPRGQSVDDEANLKAGFGK